MECPEHELTLLAIDKLPRKAERTLESVTFFGDPRLGRGAVLFGAALVLLGFVAPFVSAEPVARSPESAVTVARSPESAVTTAASALEVAIDGAGNLWLTPGAAAALLWILWRRRSRRGMRAARAAVLGLAVGGALPLIYTARRIELVAETQTAQVEWQWGLWVMAAGLVLAAFGSRTVGAGDD